MCVHTYPGTEYMQDDFLLLVLALQCIGDKLERVLTALRSVSFVAARSPVCALSLRASAQQQVGNCRSYGVLLQSYPAAVAVRCRQSDQGSPGQVIGSIFEFPQGSCGDCTLFGADPANQECLPQVEEDLAKQLAHTKLIVQGTQGVNLSGALGVVCPIILTLRRGG